MSKVTIIPSKRDDVLAEIYQQVGTKFTLARTEEDGTFQALSKVFKCRDFFTEMFVGNQQGKERSIYSFKYDPAVDGAIPDDVMYFVLTNGDDFISRIHLLHHFEELGGLTPTKVHHGTMEGEKEVYLLEADVRWAYAPQLISLYSMLVRMVVLAKEATTVKELYKVVLESGTNDGSYLKAITGSSGDKALEKLLENREVVFGKTPIKVKDGVSVNRQHNYGGIQTFLTKDNRAIVKDTWGTWVDKLDEIL